MQFLLGICILIWIMDFSLDSRYWWLPSCFLLLFCLIGVFGSITHFSWLQAELQMSTCTVTMVQLHICNMFQEKCQRLTKACCIMCISSAVQTIQVGTSCHYTTSYFTLHRLKRSGTISITAAAGEDSMTKRILFPGQSVTSTADDVGGFCDSPTVYIKPVPVF